MQVKTKNLLLGGIVTVLVLLLWYTQLYSKMESQASKQKAVAKSATTQAAQLKQQLDGTTAKKKKNGNGPSDTDLSNAVPNDPAQAAFLRNLDAVRIESGVDFVEVDANALVAGATTNSNSYQIKLVGSEDAIARYVTGLASLKRVFVLDNVTLSPDLSIDGVAGSSHSGATFLNPKLSASLSGRVFSQAGLTTATGTTATGGTGTTPVTGAPAPTGGGGSAPAVQNNG